MKKQFLLFSTLIVSSCAYSQVGINTTNPASTLDVTAKNATGTTTIVDGLLVPRVDRQRAQSMTAVPASTLIYVNNISNGTQTGTAINIDAVGHYSYDGAVWTKITPAAVNIYNSNGTLTGNRVVTQGTNTLAFTTTAVNGFSVAGTNFSVDGANNRIGIGIAAPTNTLDVNGTARVRTITPTTAATLVTPVYADATGVLVKASPSATYGGVVSNTVTVASGATATLVTGMVDGAVYKAFVAVGDACAYVTYAEYIAANNSFNGNFAIEGIYGLFSNGTKAPTFTETNRTTTTTAWTGKPGCADGGSPTSLNYTLVMPAAGTINVTNNGNIARTYYVTLTRVN